MRAKEFLSELLDRPLPIKWEEEPGYVRAYFDVNGKEGMVKFYYEAFVWTIDFFIDGRHDITGQGNELAIFSTVSKAILEFISKHNPNLIAFSAREPSRAKLYKRMSQRLTGYTIDPELSKQAGFGLKKIRGDKFINESKTTLNNMYGGHFPDRDEEFWDYVTPRELGQALTVETMQKHKVLIMLLSQYRAEHIDEITDMLDDDQQEIVQAYTNDPALSNKVIVLAGHRIIDGNHRALAAAIKGVPINYVDLADLEEPEDIDEAEVGTINAKTIATQLKAAGYQYVGSGADATVFAKDDSHVIKILMPEDMGTKAEEVFRKFYEFSMSHQDLACLPRFNEVNTIDINGKDYTQIEMERLAPIEKDSFVEGLIWFLSDYINTNTPWATVESELANSETWEIYSPNFANAFAKTWQSLTQNPASKKTYTMYRQLYNVMKLLYNTGTINKFGWDLHTANVMQRSNGQPVIIDPWFSEGTS